MRSALRVGVVIICIAVMAPAVAMAGLPGDGNDGRCDGRRSTAFERQVGEAQGFRQSGGLPNHLPHVLSVLRDAPHQVLVKEWGQLLTPQEYAYYRARVALAAKIAVVRRHVEQSAGGEDLVALEIQDTSQTARISRCAFRGTSNAMRRISVRCGCQSAFC